MSTIWPVTQIHTIANQLERIGLELARPDLGAMAVELRAQARDVDRQMANLEAAAIREIVAALLPGVIEANIASSAQLDEVIERALAIAERAVALLAQRPASPPPPAPTSIASRSAP